MANIWETTDRFGRLVMFTAAAWEHILDEHSDFRIDPHDVQITIELAEEIVQDRTYRHRQIHYRKYKSGRLWLRVVVRYRPSERHGWAGEVITAHVTRRRNKKEVSIWPSPNRI
jgi:hypothetical protein